jgi:hypothetical protein
MIHVFDVGRSPPTAKLANQDGEVARSKPRRVASVIDAIERGEFTLEAALATLESMMRRRKIPITDAGLVPLDMIDPVILCSSCSASAQSWPRATSALPEALYETLAIYLMLAIGLKGGVEIARQPIAAVVPHAWRRSHWALRSRCSSIRCCGAPSACPSPTPHRSPRTTARYPWSPLRSPASVLLQAGIPSEPHMPLLVALMEAPGIVVGIVLARVFGARHSSTGDPAACVGAGSRTRCCSARACCCSTGGLVDRRDRGARSARADRAGVLRAVQRRAGAVPA